MLQSSRARTRSKPGTKHPRSRALTSVSCRQRQIHNADSNIDVVSTSAPEDVAVKQSAAQVARCSSASQKQSTPVSVDSALVYTRRSKY
jgi:hypothetical protein